MRNWIPWLVWGLLVASCEAGGTTPSAPSTSTTPSVETTTTTEAPVDECQPEPIEGRGRAWDAGCTYTAESFLVPVTFTPMTDGWSSIGAETQYVAIRHDADLDGTSDATLTMVAHNVEAEPSEILDEIEALEGVEATSERAAIDIAGLPAVSFDVVGDPQPEPFRECSSPGGTALLSESGHKLLDLPTRPGPSVIGIPACYTSRVWVFAVDGQTITAIGVADPDDRFEELMPILENFLDTSVTFGDDDG